MRKFKAEPLANMVVVALLLSKMSPLGSKPETPCSTSIDYVARTVSARVVGYVDPRMLTSRCIAVTRSVTLSRFDNGYDKAANTTIDFVIDAEQKLGVEQFDRHDEKNGEKYFRDAIHDAHVKYYNPVYDFYTQIVPNPGLLSIASHHTAAGFAWYLDEANHWHLLRDVSLTDSKYYDYLVNGFSDGSKGAYRHALRQFRQCVDRYPTASDCSLFEGIAYEALGNYSQARAAWAMSIQKRTINNGLVPRYNEEYGVASAYLWLRLLEHVKVN